MKFVVQLIISVHIIGIDGALLGLKKDLQTSGITTADLPHEPLDHDGFQTDADKKAVHDLLKIDFGYASLFAGNDLYQRFLCQQLQSLVDRGAGDIQRCGDLGLIQDCIGGKCQVENIALDDTVDKFTVTFVFIPGGY